MTESLVVVLDDTVAGTVTRTAQGRLRFDYDDAYRQRTEPTPLSLSMPTQIRSHAHHVITPWLWGLLPDNQAVLDRWGRQFQVSTSSPFSLLATPIGEDCAGAVRFAPPDRVDAILDRPGEVTWLTEEGVAERLRDLREDSTAWLGRAFTGQFSLAGVQAKTALLFDNGRWGIPSGAIPTTHILKLAVSGFDDHDLNEHLCLEAARRAGLTAARTRVARFVDESAVIVDRYDRTILGSGITGKGFLGSGILGSGGVIARIHQEDMCQALAISPSRKYQNDGGPGPADIVGLLRRVMTPRLADSSVWRFASALIWNWLIAGTDAHAKNYSLLLSGNQVRLAPLYDVASALPYDIHEQKLHFAMKLGGDYRVIRNRNPWPAAAKDLGLDPDELVNGARTIAKAVPNAFADAANDPDVTALNRPLPNRMVDLIADRAARCLRLLEQ